MPDPKCTYPDCFSCTYPDCTKDTDTEIRRAQWAAWKRHTIARRPEHYRLQQKEYRARVESRDPGHYARLQKEYRERKKMKLAVNA